MKHNIGMTLLVMACVGCAVSEAAETVRRIDWRRRAAAGEVPAEARLVTGPRVGERAIRVEAGAGEPLTVRLAVLENPGITTARWALRGVVRCREVGEPGYLEMWNVFPDGRRFFSRTLAETGPTRRLEGVQSWRSFAVPFFSRNEDGPPSAIELNVVLPAGGSVDVGPVSLVAFREGEDPLAPPHAWWSGRTGGLLGGAMGACLGILGALIGILVGTGRAPRAASAMLWLMTAIGLVLLGVGTTAVIVRQPYPVWYTLLLIGGLATVLGLALRPVLQRRYLALEERRMRALDA